MSYQSDVEDWAKACFGENKVLDPVERNYRFLEESLELVQANGITKEEVLKLVDYVFNRPAGDVKQEVGGVMTTLATLCTAAKLDMHQCGKEELAHIWTRIDKIREKNLTKPRHSPLPGTCN